MYTIAEAQSAKADFVPFQRRVSNPSFPTRRYRGRPILQNRTPPDSEAFTEDFTVRSI